MFVQVIRGRARDAASLRARFEDWDRALKSTAQGFLGATMGVSRDDDLIAMARFSSADSARRNSERPEQDEWWRQTARLIDGEVRFHDSNDVDLVQGGGSDDADFVQVMTGVASDVERARALDSQLEEWVRKYRPDHLGAIMSWHDDGRFHRFAYFASEAEARRGERGMDTDLPEEARMQLEEWRSLMRDLAYIDLVHPWTSSP
jgi:hypothetical protein